LGAPCANLVAFGKSRLELDRNAFRQGVLDTEQVVCRLVIAFGPHRAACRCLNKVGVNPHAIARTLQAPFQNMGDAKRRPDLLRRVRPTLVCERCMSRGDKQVRQPC
jgi:hypothetical protein